MPLAHICMRSTERHCVYGVGLIRIECGLLIARAEIERGDGSECLGGSRRTSLSVGVQTSISQFKSALMFGYPTACTEIVALLRRGVQT